MQFEDINKINGTKALVNYMATMGINEYEGKLDFGNELEGRIIITGGYTYIHIEYGNAKELAINCNDDDTHIWIDSDVRLGKLELNYGVKETKVSCYKYSLGGKSRVKLLKLNMMEQLYYIETGYMEAIKCNFTHGMELLHDLNTNKNTYLIAALERLMAKRFLLEYSIETLTGVIVKNYGNNEKWYTFCSYLTDPDIVVFLEVIKGTVRFYTVNGPGFVVSYKNMKSGMKEAFEELIREEMFTLACHACCDNKTVRQVRA